MAKIRTDFVTNSSSSSFVIAYRDAIDVDKETKEKYPFIDSFMKIPELILEASGGGETEEAVIVRNQKELDEYIVATRSWSRANTLKEILEDDEDVKKDYEEMSGYISRGYNIAFKNVDNSDYALGEVIEKVGMRNDCFIVLHGGDY